MSVNWLILVVRATLDEDRRPLQGYSITVSVRCIEARLGRLGVIHSNVLVDYTQTLWTKPPDLEWADVGDAEHHFRIVIPPDSPGFTYANFQDYRVFWRIEAGRLPFNSLLFDPSILIVALLVVHHVPIFGVGSRKFKSYEIPLVRYDTRIPNYEPQPSCSNHFFVAQKPRAPTVRYRLVAPEAPVGPLDIVTIPVELRPDDPTVAIRGASLLVERRIELSETVQLPMSQPWERRSPQPVNGADGDNSSGSTLRGRSKTPDSSEDRFGEASSGKLLAVPHLDPSSSLVSLQSARSADTTATVNEQRPLLPTTMADLPAKTVSLTVAHVESSGAFRKDASGVYSKSLTLQWPASKSNSHWAMGETMQTEMIRVRFFIHVKVCYSLGYSGGVIKTDTIYLMRSLFLRPRPERKRSNWKNGSFSS